MQQWTQQREQTVLTRRQICNLRELSPAMTCGVLLRVSVSVLRLSFSFTPFCTLRQAPLDREPKCGTSIIVGGFIFHCSDVP